MEKQSYRSCSPWAGAHDPLKISSIGLLLAEKSQKASPSVCHSCVARNMDRSRVRSQWITPRWVNHVCGTQKLKDAPRAGEYFYGDIDGSQIIIFWVMTISVLFFDFGFFFHFGFFFRFFFFLSNFNTMVLFQFWLLGGVPHTQKMPFSTLSWMHMFVNVFG
jgi:hypothetical protein